MSVKILILFRVYDRTEDLKINLHIIKDTWKSFSYDIVVVSNGISKGYFLDQEVYSNSTNVITLKENAGHLLGNSQLLKEGVRFVNLENYSHVIILEADTWIYGDSIVSKYVNLMNSKGYDWASARWYDRFISLATDFAIVNSSYLKMNTDIFDFIFFPECHVANYLRDHGGKFVLIKENMQTLIPSYIHFKWPYSRKGRFNCFPKSKMVTHHIEDYAGGMKRKKRDFNCLAGFQYFDDVPATNHRMIKLLMCLSHLIQKCLLKRSWLRYREYLDIETYMNHVNANNNK